MKTDFVTRRSIPLAVLTGFLVLGSGCRNPFRLPKSPHRPHSRQQRQPRNRRPLRHETTSRLAVTFRQRSRPSRL